MSHGLLHPKVSVVDAGVGGVTWTTTKMVSPPPPLSSMAAVAVAVSVVVAAVAAYGDYDGAGVGDGGGVDRYPLSIPVTVNANADLSWSCRSTCDHFPICLGWAIVPDSSTPTKNLRNKRKHAHVGTRMKNSLL